jgi:menaquinone-dependent protoporphyrinogen oxidase
MRIIFLLTLLFAFGLCSAQKKPHYSDAVIVYMSKHGTTAKVAGMIKDSIKNEPVTIINLKKQKNPDVKNCDLILIGGSFHVGKIQKNVRRFCRKNEELLLTKTVGIFVCGMFTGDEAKKEFNNAFSEKLRNHAKAKSFMGYELYFEKMNPVTRSIMKKNSGATQNVYKIDLKSLGSFVAELIK